MESKFGYGHHKVEQLLKVLDEKEKSLNNFIGQLHKEVNFEMKKVTVGKDQIHTILAVLKKFVKEEYEKMKDADQADDERTSESLAAKASVHALRFKLIFQHHSKDPDVQKNDCSNSKGI